LAGGSILLLDYASLVLLLIFGVLQVLFWYIADQSFITFKIVKNIFNICALTRSK
jgi:hypothetical protein